MLRNVRAIIAEYPEVRTLLLLGLGTGLLSMLFVELSRSLLSRSTSDGIAVGFIILAFTGTIVTCMRVVRLALRLSFRREGPRRLIVTIATSYVVLSVSFASVYYALAAGGDYRDAELSYDFYALQREQIENGERVQALHRAGNERAFSGIRERLWLGVEEFAVAELGFEADFDPADYAAVTKADRKDVVRFCAGLRPRLIVFFDCMHLSVATMTTLGYGNVSPRISSARICSDIQVLSSGLLVLVALGLALGSMHRSPAGAESETETGA